MISRPIVLISNGYYSNFVLFEMEKVFDIHKWFYGKSARSAITIFMQYKHEIKLRHCDISL